MQRYKNFIIILTTCFFTFLVTEAYGQKMYSDDYFALAKKEGNVHKNFKKALEYTKKAASLAPLDMDIQEYLGKCYMELGELEKARIVLLKVLDKSPKRVDARHYLVNIETQTKRYSSAVCYVNELLEITPYSKTLWQRKINLYNLMDNKIEASRATKRLYQIFPEDEDVKGLYRDLLKEEALYTAKKQDLTQSAKQYEKALEVAPDDADTYLKLINTYIKLGNYNAALETADKALYYLPYNKEIITKKIGILQEKQEYHKAIAFIEEQNKKMPSAFYNDMLLYLRSEMAAYYRNSDPYTLYGQVYETDKSNKEAYDYLLNTSLSRGYYPAAEELIGQGLKSNPNSKELLSKQLYLYEMQQNKPKEEATIQKMYALYPNDTDVVEKYNAWSFKTAKDNFSAHNYKEAEPAFVRLTEFGEYEKFANQYLFSIYLEQQEYDKAEVIIDKLMRKYPDDNQLVVRKVDLLTATDSYQEAYDLLYQYKNRYPDDKQLRFAISDLSVKYIRFLNEEEDYLKASEVATNLIILEPETPQAYRYAIGAFSQMGNYQEALNITEMALEAFPENKDFRLAQADIQSKLKNHQQAIQILNGLRTEYPYNSKIKGSLIEELHLLAKDYQEHSENEKAKETYKEILQIRAKDTLASIKLAKIFIEEKDYDQALQTIDSGLLLNPNHNELTYLKGVTLEKMQNYQEAIKHLKAYQPLCGETESHKDYIRFVESKMLKNQFNFAYLRSTTDSLGINTSIATFEYMRFENKNTYIGRLNYASRADGVGLQAEADWYHTFDDKSYFIANAGIANKYFSKVKAGLSYFMPFKKDYFIEIGGRYTKLRDDRNLFTGILGAEREFNNVWVNLKAMLISDGEDLYHSILAQSRFYLDNNRDYLIVMASAGTAPEDEKLDFQVNTLLSYVNTMVGAGYYRFVTHRTSFGIMGNWYNLKISPDYYVNQYNLYFTIRTKF